MERILIASHGVGGSVRKEDPVGRQIIDLSIAIEAGLPSDPEMMIPKIDYVDHAQGAEQMTQFFPGLQKQQSSSCPTDWAGPWNSFI